MAKMLMRPWQRIFSKKRYLVLDVGTTGVKAFVFDEKYKIRQMSYKRLAKKVDANGLVEQDPMEILNSSIEVLQEVAKKERLRAGDDVKLGITNQRETTVIWDKNTGVPTYNAISWEDIRTKKIIDELPSEEKWHIKEKTGLSPEPYFSAPKIKWILTESRAKPENLLFGTIDTWILWNISFERSHMTDITNAGRTLLFGLQKMEWEEDLLTFFDIPKNILPTVRPSCSDFGYLREEILGFTIPIRAICGDQQGSLFAAGQEIGTTKITYGTGAFLMQIIPEFHLYDHFYTTLAASNTMVPVYAVEAKVNNTGVRVDNFYLKGEPIDEEVKKIVQETVPLALELPILPKVIIIDGGISNYEPLPDLQAQYSGILSKRQITPHGTALGVARLLALDKDTVIDKTRNFMLKGN